MKKTVQTANLTGSYGGFDTVAVQETKRGFRTYGAGYAGRVYYRTVERAMRVVETDARFQAWKAA